jgi:hypothetical protein
VDFGLGGKEIAVNGYYERVATPTCPTQLQVFGLVMRHLGDNNGEAVFVRRGNGAVTWGAHGGTPLKSGEGHFVVASRNDKCEA